MASALPKLEGQITFASAQTVTVTENGGASIGPITVAAANTEYYLRSSTDLLAAIGTAITADGTTAGTWTLTIDDDDDTSTGKVTIAVAGVATWTLTWVTSALPLVLGYTGNPANGATATSSNASRYIYLPNQQRVNALMPDGSVGLRVRDGSITMAPGGQSKRLVYSQRYVERLEYRYLRGSKAAMTHESVTNESIESFWLYVMGEGRPFRYHPLRQTDGTYRDWVAVALNECPIRPSFPGVVGTSASVNANLLFDFGPIDLIADV